MSGEAGVGQRGLEFGVGLRLRVNDFADLVGEFGAGLLGLVTASVGEGVEAADAAAEFVEAGVDGVAAPPERGLGQAGGAGAVGVGHLGLIPPPLGTGQQFGRQQDSVPCVVREFRQSQPLRETNLITESPKLR